MGIMTEATRTLGRARYVAAQGLRVAWYGAHYAVIRPEGGAHNRPGEPKFEPSNPKPDLSLMRKAYFELFRQDMANVEAGLYPAPKDVRLRDLPRALKSSRLFMRDTSEVERRRVSRNGTEVRDDPTADPKRFPAYYRQNFHYQSDGWLSDESARIYDTQVEILFTGTADAMRRAVLAEIARELKGRDQRKMHYLDMACGTGRFLRQTMETFPRLQASGLDLSPNYCASARRKVAPWSHVDVIEGAGEAIPLEDASLDILANIYLFHELPPKVRGQVIAEVGRVVKPGGVFVLADSLQFGDRPEIDGLLEYFPQAFHEPYFKSYLAYDFASVLEAAGFKHERQTLAFMTKVSVWRKQS